MAVMGAVTDLGQALVFKGDCNTVLDDFDEDSFDSVVTDPPYHLTALTKRFGKEGSAPAKGAAFQRHNAGFMGQSWDGGDVAFQVATWERVYRVLKPGGHLIAFSGTRTYHRMVCAIEDAGFEIRDQLVWLYGQGFPKSLDVSKAIDKAARGVPQGAADPTSPNHGRYRTQATTEGSRDDGDGGQGYGAGPGQFMREPGKKKSEGRRAGG